MAHDTIYKPMTDVGFGAAKIEAMRKRLRKVMQEHLQPAGYAFDKIASDYAHLRDGKEMFDGDALAAIRRCNDRNSLEETVERYSNFVLPHVDNYAAAAPDIIDALSDAAMRAPGMPEVPLKYFNRALLKGLSPEQIHPLLELMTEVPRLSHDGEAMLAVIAAEHVQAVINLIGRRFQHDSTEGDVHYQDLPHGLSYLRAPLSAAPREIVAAARAWFDANPAFSQFHGGRLIRELYPHLEHPLYPLLYGQLEQGREGIDFVLSVLRAYEGEKFLHPLLRAIVGFLPGDDELLNIVDIVIDSSGVLVGEYGSVEAQEARKALVAEWEADENQAVRDFAARFIRSADNQLAMERRRADRTVALRHIEFDGL